MGAPDTLQQEYRWLNQNKTLLALALSQPGLSPQDKETIVNIINLPPSVPWVPYVPGELPPQIPLDVYPTQPVPRVVGDILQVHPELIKPSHNMFDLQNVSEEALFWLTMLMLGKKDPKAVRDILVTMFSGVSKALESYCRAGVANRITAWGSGRLLSLYMERLGMLTQPQAVAYSDGLSIMAGASIAEGFTGLVLPWKFTSQDTQFPDQVTLAETGETKISGGAERVRTVSIGKAAAEPKKK